MKSRIAILATALLAGLMISSGAAHAQSPGLTIDQQGSFSALTGIATVSGTYSCGESSGSGLIEVTLSQDVGRVATISGGGFYDITCQPGQTGVWSTEVVPTSGEYRGGSAFASARLVLNGEPVTETGSPVQLSGGQSG